MRLALSVVLLLAVAAFVSAQCPCDNARELCGEACHYHGTCNSNQVCECDAGWSGEECTVPMCDDCSGHGTCIPGSPNACICNPGWEGDNCEQLVCHTGGDCCTLHGECNRDGVFADLAISVESLNPSLHVKTMEPCHCAVDEGCALDGTRLLVRFNTETQNVGTADLQVGLPGEDIDLWEWHECHQHNHFRDFAEFRMRRNGQEFIDIAHKSGFCMVDSFRWDPSAPGNRDRYTCANQGIQAGWSDMYGKNLDCQWVDVTNQMAHDDWVLELEVNPARHIFEGDYDNNIISISLACDNECEADGRGMCVFGTCVCMPGESGSFCQNIPDFDFNMLANFGEGRFGDNDLDGVGNMCDNCLDDPNGNQADEDRDGVGDMCDLCPSIPDPCPSSSPSPSSSESFSSTPSRTSSTSQSAPPSMTQSPTVSGTRTSSASSSESPSMSASGSATPTPSLTVGASPSSSSSRSVSVTSTRSASFAENPNGSISDTGSRDSSSNDSSDSSSDSSNSPNSGSSNSNSGGDDDNDSGSDSSNGDEDGSSATGLSASICLVAVACAFTLL